MNSTYFAEFLLLAGAHIAAVMSPGPDFLITLRQSVQRGLSPARWTALGIGAGILVHITYIVLGVAVFLRSNSSVMLGVQWLGAAYLLWLAWQCFQSKVLPQQQPDSAPTVVPQTAKQAFLLGFITNVLNPKATMFFLALYTNVISVTTPVWLQSGYGLWMALTTALWFLFVAQVMVQPAIRTRFLAKGPLVDRVLGVLLTLVAVRLLLA